MAEGSGDNVELEALSDYAMQYGTQKAQLGIVGNIAYQFTPNHRLSVENFYTHTGRDEGRIFEGYNLDNNRVYRNYRLQFIEEGLISNAVGGEHFFQGLSNSRLDWRVNSARAKRDEPGLRESLYEYTPPAAGAADTAVRARRRIAGRVPDVQQSERQDAGRERQLEHSSARRAGRRSSSSA